jgi:hypothetical protein
MNTAGAWRVIDAYGEPKPVHLAPSVGFFWKICN